MELCTSTILTALLGLLASGLFLIWWKFLLKSKDLPPGPSGFASLITAFKFGKAYEGSYLSEFLTSLLQKYGPICCMKSGVQTFIFIQDTKIITEVLKSEAFAYRPIESVPSMKRLMKGSPKGLFNNNGSAALEMRKFVLLTLRDLGVGKKSIDEVVQTEATVLSQELEKLSQTETAVVHNFRRKAQHAASSVIHHVVFGFRYEVDVPKWKVLLDKLFGIFAVNFLAFPENTIPFLGRFQSLHSYLCSYEDVKFYEMNDYISDYMKKQIDEHRDSYSAEDIRDFTDLYIKYEREHREHYTKDNVFETIMDIFLAGTDTTATALTWSMLYLLKYPQIQQQLRDEIDEVVGDKVFERTNREKLVKVQAFICEMHRYVTIVMPPPPRTVMKPTELHGYTIPPNAIILANFHTVHHEKEYWGDPEVFRIERWINKSGKLMYHEGHFMPFSTGRRACPGRQLAEIELIIFLVEILQKYRFTKLEGEELSENALPGLIQAPRNFSFRVEKR